MIGDLAKRMIGSRRGMVLAAILLAGALLGAPPAVVAQQVPADETGVMPDAAAVAPDAAAVMPDAAAVAPDAAAVTPDAAAADPATAAKVQTLGDGDQKLFLVDHHGTWSMHAENVTTEQIFRLWSENGGPQITTKSLLDRPYTLSVHRLEPERIVERVLEGYSYTLHYDADARLERVRVYSLSPTAMFKTPRLVETLGKWKEVETAAPAAAPEPVPVEVPAEGVPAAEPATP